MRNTKYTYCTLDLEVAFKQASINLFLDYKQYPLIFLKRTAGTLTSLFTVCMECCCHANCLRIPMDTEEGRTKNHHGAVGK